MKTNKRSKTKMVTALVWAAIILTGSFLLKSVEGNEQGINFFILITAIYVSLFLNGSNKLSCKTLEQKTER